MEWQLLGDYDGNSFGFDAKVDKWHKFAKFRYENGSNFVLAFENNVKKIPNIAITSSSTEQDSGVKTTAVSISVDEKEKLAIQFSATSGHLELVHSMDFPVQKIIISGGISPPKFHLAVNDKEVRFEVNSLLKGRVNTKVLDNNTCMDNTHDSR